ncbi:MAG TPA: hypothetical protein VM580_04840 [Labilithrix sp.]|nr:hypothetical protein [Labilithrix sp.]
MVERWTGQRWAALLLRALVFALTLPLASSGALPLWARLVGVEGPHVCRCSIEKHDCDCVRCNPDHEESTFTSESLTGRCGDDELAFGGKVLLSVLPASSVLAPVSMGAAAFLPSVFRRADFARPPPTPPPRASSLAV